MPEARDRLPGRGPGGSALLVGDGAGLHFGERPRNGIQERLDRGRFGNDENAPPQGWRSRRGVPSRRSPLPEWYPRTPLRDITAIVQSIELWNERQRARGAARRRNRQHSPRTPLLLLSSPSSAELGSDSPHQIPPPTDASPQVPEKEVSSPVSTTPPAPLDEKTRLYWEELDQIAMVILERKRKEMEDKKKKKPEKSTLMSLR